MWLLHFLGSDTKGGRHRGRVQRGTGWGLWWTFIVFSDKLALFSCRYQKQPATQKRRGSPEQVLWMLPEVGAQCSESVLSGS